MTPVIQAYTLGKSQEVTRLLTSEGIPVLQHGNIYQVSQLYEALELSAGPVRAISRPCGAGWAIIVPPGIASHGIFRAKFGSP